MPTWMVVEDEPDIYDVLLAMFEIWGIEGVAFVDGAEAVAWIEDVDAGRVRGELPELAILDIRLPEVSGPKVGARLRQSPVLGDIAIVLITAYRLTPEEEAGHIAEAQADRLMYKPLPGMIELRHIMDTVIARRRQIKAARMATEAKKVNVEAAQAAAPAAKESESHPVPAAKQPGPQVKPPITTKTEPAPPPPSSSNGKSTSNR